MPTTLHHDSSSKTLRRFGNRWTAEDPVAAAELSLECRHKAQAASAQDMSGADKEEGRRMGRGGAGSVAADRGLSA